MVLKNRKYSETDMISVQVCLGICWVIDLLMFFNLNL